MADALKQAARQALEAWDTKRLPSADLTLAMDAMRASLSQPEPEAVQVPQGWVDGVNAAAKLLDKKADEYAGQFGGVDPETGAFEFKREAQLEYHSTLVELADEIRATLAAAPQSPAQAEERGDEHDIEQLPGKVERRCPRCHRHAYHWLTAPRTESNTSSRPKAGCVNCGHEWPCRVMKRDK